MQQKWEDSEQLEVRRNALYIMLNDFHANRRNIIIHDGIRLPYVSILRCLHEY